MTRSSKILLLACIALAAPSFADTACRDIGASSARLRAASMVMPAKPAQLRVGVDRAVMSGAEVTALRNHLRIAAANCQLARRNEAKSETEMASDQLDDLK